MGSKDVIEAFGRIWYALIANSPACAPISTIVLILRRDSQINLFASDGSNCLMSVDLMSVALPEVRTISNPSALSGLLTSSLAIFLTLTINPISLQKQSYADLSFPEFLRRSVHSESCAHFEPLSFSERTRVF